MSRRGCSGMGHRKQESPLSLQLLWAAMLATGCGRGEEAALL